MAKVAKKIEKSFISDSIWASKEKIQEYGECLDALQEQNGFLTPGLIVSAAELSDSPIHDFFEWNDQAAARKYRLERARYLIRNIKVVIQKNGGEEVIRNYFNVKITKEDRGYVSLQVVRTNEDFQKQVIDHALEEVNRWRKKYSLYKELQPIHEAIEKVTKAVNGTA